MTPIVLSILSPLENVLRNILVWLHETGGLTWAWAIVALTILVRMALVPLMVRQIHSMQSLQMHAPEMKAIQQKWKHDRQRQNEELMKFYRENKINPASSCLPIVAQIPVFFSLYLVLKHFTSAGGILDTYGGSTQWLHLWNITEKVSVGWGPLLLVIYVISQLSSSWFMTTTMQGAQRWLMLVLPVFFVPFLLRFPTGLMIYWLTTNLWTTGQGVITRRMVPRPAPPPKRSSRTPPAEQVAAVPESLPEKADGKPRTDPAGGNGRKPVAGPPRRVKRKRGGGGRR